MRWIIPILALMAPAHAGPYLQFGIGFIHNIPAYAEVEATFEDGASIRVEEKGIIRLDSTHPIYGAGYRFKSNLHIELEVQGELGDKDHSITTFKVYKRWEWE
jgi:hypothetical protein